MTRYILDVLNNPMGYDISTFNNARPVKKRTVTQSFGYSEILSGGLVRAFTGAVVTLWHLLTFPFVMLRVKPDIVHVCGVSFSAFWENAVYMFIARRIFRKKIFFHYLGAFDEFWSASSPSTRKRIIKVFHLADRVAVLNNKAEMIVKTFFDNDRLSVIRSSVDTHIFDPAKSETMDLSLPENSIKILFVGGFDPHRKGIDDILAVVPDVIAQNQRVFFLLSGGEIVKDRIDTATDKAAKEHIVFLGLFREEEKVKVYTTADMLLLPSYNEGLPYVIIEALSMGLPIIASSVGGIPEAVIHEQNGFIIQPGDREMLKNYILKVADDENLRATLSRNNRERACRLYSLEKQLEQIRAVYVSLQEER